MSSITWGLDPRIGPSLSGFGHSLLLLGVLDFFPFVPGIRDAFGDLSRVQRLHPAVQKDPRWEKPPSKALRVLWQRKATEAQQVPHPAEVEIVTIAFSKKKDVREVALLDEAPDLAEAEPESLDIPQARPASNPARHDGHIVGHLSTEESHELLGLPPHRQGFRVVTEQPSVFFLGEPAIVDLAPWRKKIGQCGQVPVTRKGGRVQVVRHGQVIEVEDVVVEEVCPADQISQKRAVLGDPLPQA